MRRAGPLLAVLLVCACGWVEVGDPGKTSRSPQAPEPRKAVSEDTRILVRKGDSVYLISRRHGIAMRDIIERNGLTAPYHLREGQMLILPASRKHVVVSGDSLWSISQRYDVPMAALVRANGLKRPFTIYPGTTLRIPRPMEPAPADAPETTVAATSGPAKPPKKPSRPSLVRGTPPVPSPSPPALAKAPPPSGSGTVKSDAGVPKPRRPLASTSASVPASRPSAAEKPAPRTVAEPPSAPVRTALKPLPPRAGRFLRPVAGPVVARFGPQPDGLHNDGINIAAPRGAAVHSVEAGRVAYSGNELPGYGNLLLVRHRGGWVSAYAHNDRLLVGRGDEVQRGQRIALVGSSGRVTTPQLHFELRRQGRAVDPSPHLDGG